MPRSLYIATNQNATGKRSATLGMMELAAQRFDQVAFFRPIVPDDPSADHSIRLMRSRYTLPFPADELAGITRSMARRLLADDRYSQLLHQIQQRYKLLEEKVDFVVVEGTGFQGLGSEIEFELNADIAANLGSPILSVYAMGGDTIEETVRSVQIGNDAFSDHGCNVLATIVNQVPESHLVEIREACRSGAWCQDTQFYFLPEAPILRQPTIREIQMGLNAQVFAGDESTFDREVTQIKVAAMQLPTFLERMTPGSLIITPGDRSDIIAGCMLAGTQSNAVGPAGMVLSGGLLPPQSVSQLVQSPDGLPILSVPEDTYTIAKKASKIRAEIDEHSPRKIESVIGLFEQHVDVDALAERLRAPSKHRVTPLLFEYSLIQAARQQRVKIVLPEGKEPRILQAVDILHRRGVADLILLGDEAKIESAAARLGIVFPETGVEIIDPQNSPLRKPFTQCYYELRKHKGVTTDVARDRMADLSYFGTMMVYQDLAGGMVSGSIHTTANTIRPAFEFIKTRPGVGVVSSVFLMCLKSGVLVYGDCAVIPNPTAEQLVEIASSSADTATQFGIEPRVAMLSYSTGESGDGEDVQRVRRATKLLRQQRPDLPVEGPIQYDAAIDPSVAATKMPGSQVAGRATVLVFPDLNTGNNTYKAVQRSAGAVAIGPVLQGLKKPVNDLSRGCTVTDIVNTVAITAIQAQQSGRVSSA